MSNRAIPATWVTGAIALVVAAGTATVAEASAWELGWPLRVSLSLLLGVGVAAMVRSGLIAPLVEAAACSERARAAAAAELTLRHHTETVLGEVRDALGGVADEADLLDLCGRAVGRIVGDRDNALLLCAPGATNHVMYSCEVVAGALAPPRSLPAGSLCLAPGSDSARATLTSDQLDACPHVAVDDLEVSSVCVALHGPSGPIAVINSLGPQGEVPHTVEIEALERLAQLIESHLLRLALARRGATDDPGGPIERPVIAHDALTGLPDHVAGLRALRALVESLTPFAVALCNIDALGEYNERYGRHVGDLALCIASRVLGETLRPSDLVCRMHGDTFLAVFPNCAAPQALAAVERVREGLVLRLAEDGAARFTCSIGVADSRDGESIEAILESADLAMSIAKYQGGNRVRLAEPDAETAGPVGPAVSE